MQAVQKGSLVEECNGGSCGEVIRGKGSEVVIYGKGYNDAEGAEVICGRGIQTKRAEVSNG